MIDIAPLFKECIALMTLDELKEAEKVLQTGISAAARKVVEAIREEKAKRK